MNFDEVFYLTDTGRRWDGWKTSVRDKVPQQDLWIKQGLTFHSTQNIIDTFTTRSMKNGAKVPSKIMFTMHPQRWSEGGIPWLKELVLQNLKNQLKRAMILYKSK